MVQSQLVIAPIPTTAIIRPGRPLAVMGVVIASWGLGCALSNDAKNDAKSGLETGGPALGCFMSAKIDCPLRCDDIDFDAVCDATLGAACDGQCAAEATGTCLDDCNADCAVGCNADGDVSCHVSCDDRCGDNCQTLCAGAWNSEQCVETCKGQCDSSCRESCQKRTDASCDGTCGASCNATCSVEAHVACQIKCSVDGFTTCKAKVAAQCVAECSSAVMLTCSDPSSMPDDGKAPVRVDDAPSDADKTRAGGVANELAVQGFARKAARGDSAAAYVEPPPLVEASRRDDPDGGVTIEPADVPSDESSSR